jgi:NAD+ kinase
MKIAIYSRGIEADQQADLEQLFGELNRNNIKSVIYSPFFEKIRSTFSKPESVELFHTADELNESIDFVISLGGDGTMLDTVTLVRNKKIPVLGINFGRLGFLAGIGRKALHSAVRALVNRTYVIDNRALIHVDGDKMLFDGQPYGLNEFAIHKTDTSPMVGYIRT